MSKFNKNAVNNLLVQNKSLLSSDCSEIDSKFISIRFFALPVVTYPRNEHFHRPRD
jgi:hypothetical protein